MILLKQQTQAFLKTGTELELQTISQKVTQLSSFTLSDDEVDWSTANTFKIINYEPARSARAQSVPKYVLPCFDVYFQAYELHNAVSKPVSAPAHKKKFTKYQLYKLEKEYKKHQSLLNKSKAQAKKTWRAH